MGCCNNKQLKSNQNQKNIDSKGQSNKLENFSPQPAFKTHPMVADPFPQNQYAKSEGHAHTLHNKETEESRLLDEIIECYHLCKYYYQEHDIDEAHYFAEHFLRKFAHYKKLPAASDVVLESSNTYLKLIDQVNEEYNDVVNISEEIGRGGWVQKSHKKGVRISTRREGSTVGTLVQTELDQPFEILISILIEMDLYKDFMPFMKISRQEKIVARNCRIGYTENHFPILSVREAFFQGIGYNRLDHDNTLFLCTRSINNREDLQQKLGYKCEINPDNVQLEYKYFILRYEPIQRGKGKITLAMNVDTKIAFIPIWLQDKISQDFGHMFYTSVLKQTKGFEGSKWQKNVQENPALFNFFKGAIDQRLSQMENQKLKEENARQKIAKRNRINPHDKPIELEIKQQVKGPEESLETKGPQKPMRRSRIFKKSEINN